MTRHNNILCFSSIGANFDNFISDSIILDRPTEIPSLLLVDINAVIIKGGYAAVTVHDGKIVSSAVVTQSDKIKAGLEMTVETSPKYRRNGFALDNAKLLSSFLTSRQINFYYFVREKNIASVKIAKSLNLVPFDINN